MCIKTFQKFILSLITLAWITGWIIPILECQHILIWVSRHESSLLSINHAPGISTFNTIKKYTITTWMARIYFSGEGSSKTFVFCLKWLCVGYKIMWGISIACGAWSVASSVLCIVDWWCIKCVLLLVCVNNNNIIACHMKWIHKGA